jgi:hypothetical protein
MKSVARYGIPARLTRLRWESLTVNYLSISFGGPEPVSQSASLASSPKASIYLGLTHQRLILRVRFIGGS